MSPFDGFLDFRRVNPMPGNMAGIVQIPIEAFCVIQHSCSIYNYCIYGNATRPIAINLRTPGRVKTVRVGFPSDDEWAERQRRRKVVIRQLGRGASETIVANGEDVGTARGACAGEAVGRRASTE